VGATNDGWKNLASPVMLDVVGTMRRDQVLELLSEQRDEIVRRFGVASIRLFGSVARDQASDDSDVDLLVGFRSPPRFREFMDLRFFLEDLLGAKVDLITESGLKPQARPHVENEAIRVA
jgi:predicted nucleotidyltransferase